MQWLQHGVRPNQREPYGRQQRESYGRQRMDGEMQALARLSLGTARLGHRLFSSCLCSSHIHLVHCSQVEAVGPMRPARLVLLPMRPRSEDLPSRLQKEHPSHGQSVAQTQRKAHPTRQPTQQHLRPSHLHRHVRAHRHRARALASVQLWGRE